MTILEYTPVKSGPCRFDKVQFKLATEFKENFFKGSESNRKNGTFQKIRKLKSGAFQKINT